MEVRIKLIWDFRGPDAEKTAQHHVHHLNEFAAMELLENPVSGVESISEMHYVAFLVVERSKMISVRDALKPHRAVIAK